MSEGPVVIPTEGCGENGIVPSTIIKSHVRCLWVPNKGRFARTKIGQAPLEFIMNSTEPSKGFLCQVPIGNALSPHRGSFCLARKRLDAGRPK